MKHTRNFPRFTILKMYMTLSIINYKAEINFSKLSIIKKFQLTVLEKKTKLLFYAFYGVLFKHHNRYKKCRQKCRIKSITEMS